MLARPPPHQHHFQVAAMHLPGQGALHKGRRGCSSLAPCQQELQRMSSACWGCGHTLLAAKGGSSFGSRRLCHWQRAHRLLDVQRNKARASLVFGVGSWCSKTDSCPTKNWVEFIFSFTSVGTQSSEYLRWRPLCGSCCFLPQTYLIF